MGKLEKIPEGSTVVWKKNPLTKKLEPKIVRRKGYTRRKRSKK
jgi:hypothetical protein